MFLINREMVCFHVLVIIGATLAGFCGHGSWGHDHDHFDYSQFRDQRAAGHGLNVRNQQQQQQQQQPQQSQQLQQPQQQSGNYYQPQPIISLPTIDPTLTRRSTDSYLQPSKLNVRIPTDDDIPQDHLTNILKDHEIISDIIDSAPRVVPLKVVYDNNAAVNNGDELKPEETVDRPVEISWEADENSYYTLLFVDPDAPTRQDATERSWQHWVVGNILGNDIDSGNILTEYNGPTPPRGSGLHRYVFLVFEQKEGIIPFRETRIRKSNQNRGKFSVREFTAKYHLGQPIAVNFFQAKQ